MQILVSTLDSVFLLPYMLIAHYLACYWNRFLMLYGVCMVVVSISRSIHEFFDMLMSRCWGWCVSELLVQYITMVKFGQHIIWSIDAKMFCSTLISCSVICLWVISLLICPFLLPHVKDFRSTSYSLLEYLYNPPQIQLLSIKWLFFVCGVKEILV